MKPITYHLNKIIAGFEAKKRLPVVRSHPQNLTFLMIDKCNANCVMCGGDYLSSSSGRMITFEKYSRIVANLQMDKIEALSYGGAGDPLLNPHLGEIAQHVADNYQHIETGIITNAINLDEKNCCLILDKIGMVTISLNAAQSGTYYKIMQVDKFDKVCENIARLRDLKEERGSRCRIYLSIIISKRNTEELVPFVELAKKFGASGIFILYCRFYPEQIRQKHFDLPGNSLIQEESLFFHQELANKHLTKAGELAQKYGLDWHSEPLFGEKFIPRPCLYPWQSLYIGFDGELYPCAAGEVLFRNKVEKGIYQSGNILKNNIKAIWNNEFFITLRKTNSGHVLMEECACCGNSICWSGPDNLRSHILDWTKVLGT
ncbi:MAG: radical SAM protein [Candidatus Schekmanbacteria bacterium]|nr:radical SAM protein [Candidatus Schekmanbacteria bacterium]